MRILIICESFPSTSTEDPVMPAHTGLARALREQGHELMVISFANPFDQYGNDGIFDVDGITVHHIRADFARYEKWSQGVNLTFFNRITSEGHQLFSKLAKVVEEFRPDVIDCQEFNALAFFFAREHKHPLVIRCYGPLAHLMRTGDIGSVSWIDTELVEIMEMATVAEADGIVACSTDIARRTAAKCGREPDEIGIIRVPLSPPTAVPKPTPAENNDDFPKLFFFGRVERQKGADLLLNSLPMIAKRFPKFRMTVGGMETKEHGSSKSYADLMRDQLKENGLLDRVQFLGRLSRHQIKQNVVDADICIFPSKYETAGYACMEAISYGGAVVATAVGGLPEYHKHGESLCLVEPNSAPDLAQGIIDLAENDALRAQLKAKGRDYIYKVCDPSLVATQSVQAYEKAIKKFATRTGPNHSFQVLGKMVSVLIEQPGTMAKHPSAPPAQVNSAIDATNLVKNLGEMVLGHLTRNWKEGYEAGLADGLRQGNHQAMANISMGSLLYQAARRVKHKLVKPAHVQVATEVSGVAAQGTGVAAPVNGDHSQGS